MITYNIKCVRVGEEEELLRAGYEPFAVSARNTSYEFYNTSAHKRETQHQTEDYIYLRKVKDEKST